MKLIQLIIISIIVAMLLQNCSSKKNSLPKRHEPTEKELSTFETQLISICNELKIKELSFAVVNESEILMAKDINQSAKTADESKTYPIGAASGVFASALMLQLAENEKIELKNLIGNYGAPNYVAKDASLKNMLTHTSIAPAGTSYGYNIANYDALDVVFKSCSGKGFSELLKKNICRKLDMGNTEAKENQPISSICTSNVYDLAKFSMAIDNKLLFEKEETSETLFRPAFLKDGELTPCALGWFVQFEGNNEFAWTFGQGKGYSSLIIKSLTDSLSLVVLANSENLNAPFNLQSGNMLQSPVLVSFLKTFILHDVKLPDVSINKTDSVLLKELQKSDTSEFREVLVDEFITYINMQQYMGNAEKASHLESLYSQAFSLEVPFNLLNKKPLAEINNVADYVNLERKFTVSKDTTVQILAVGEFVKEMEHSIWEYDGVEMYFDINNDKKTSFDYIAHRQYRFDYDYPEVTGNFVTNQDIKFVQADPSTSSYLFEISIPWKTLNSFIPKTGKRIGFDMNCNDNDGNSREAMQSWHYQKEESAWSNPSVYGTVLLCNTPEGLANDSICYAVRMEQPIVLDGKIDAGWQKSPRYTLHHNVGGYKPVGASDFSVSFRSAWNNENLYFLIEVIDDKKCKFPIGGDFGLLEDEKHDTIWIMTPENTQYAGGAETNRSVITSLPLKKGSYTLKYSSNQTNSYLVRTSKRPAINFYGIAIY